MSNDYAEDYPDLNFKFTTRTVAGVPFALAGTPVISVYKSNDTTQSVAGVTLTVDFDTVTGLNNVKIDLSADAFYAIEEDYDVVITTGTVNSVSVVGEVVYKFSIENRWNEADVTHWDGTLVGALEDSTDIVNALTPDFRRIQDLIEYQRGQFSYTSSVFYVAPTNGNDGNPGTRASPFATVGAAHTAATAFAHDLILLVPDNASGQTILDEQITITKDQLMIRGPGNDFSWITTSTGDLITVTGGGVQLSGFEARTHSAGSGDAIVIDADFCVVEKLQITQSRGDGVQIADGSSNNLIQNNLIDGVGSGGSGQAIQVTGTSTLSEKNTIRLNRIFDSSGDGIFLTGSNVSKTLIRGNIIRNNTGFGINISANVSQTEATGNTISFNDAGLVNDLGVDTFYPEQFIDLYGDAVHIDFTNGTPGDEPLVNGTIAKKVDNFPDARTIADEFGIRTFKFTAGFTGVEPLDQSYTNWIFDITSGTFLGINSQDVTESVFLRSGITGIVGGSGSQTFDNCGLVDLTIPPGNAIECPLRGTITLSGAGSWWFSGCSSLSTTVLNIVMANAGASATFPDFHGGVVNLQSMVTGGEMHIPGVCSVVVNANCSGGTLRVAGNVHVSGAVGNLDSLIREANTDSLTWDAAQSDHQIADTFGKFLDVEISSVSSAISALNDFNPATDPVANVTANADMRGTDGANTVVPDAAGTAPTAVENRQEMDSNSIQLASIKTDTGTGIPTLIRDTAIQKGVSFTDAPFPMFLTGTNTPAPGLTVTATRSLDAGAFQAVTGSISEIGSGFYQFDASAADTNGDIVIWLFSSGTADTTSFTYFTIS